MVPKTDRCAATPLALACHSEEEEETVENVCLAVGQPSVSRQPQALSTRGVTNRTVRQQELGQWMVCGGW